MATEIGEYLVGAYLKLELNCNVVDYNARPPGGGLQGLGELDVIGLDFLNRRAYLCEVTTHLNGLLIPNRSGADGTISKIEQKHQRQRAYAEHLIGFAATFMFWSPVVRPSVVEKLKQIKGLDLFVNARYKEAIDRLRALAKVSTSDANNPAYRLLQILEHLEGASLGGGQPARSLCVAAASKAPSAARTTR